MVIYYKNSNFDLFRFKDFDNHTLSNPNDIKKHLLSFIFKKRSLYDFRGNKQLNSFNQKDFENLFINISNKQPYDFFNMLISIYPAIIFSGDLIKVNTWDIFKSSFRDVTNEEKRLLKAAINFRLNIDDIESELNAINRLPYAEIDKPKVYQSLFTALYKYVYVLFAKSIDFPVPVKDQIDCGKYYHFDFLQLEKMLGKHINAYQNSNDFSRRHVSGIYIDNVCKSAKLDSIDAIEYFLSDIKPFTKYNLAKQLFFDAFNLALKIDINKTRFRSSSILRPIAQIVILPLFFFFFDRPQDKENVKYFLDNLSK